MSSELHVLLPTDNLPTRDAWQDAIDSLALPVRLDEALRLPSLGFTPCLIRGEASGFELYVDAVAELVAAYPTLRAHPHTTHAISFRWGSDLHECACVMAAAAGLVHGWSAIAYDPNADAISDIDALKADFAACTIDE